jgi:integrase
MNDEIKVCVVDRGRRYLYLRYICPDTGKPVEKSAKTSNPKEAERAAGKWQAELREGRYQRTNHMSWESFREFYSANALPGLAVRTGDSYESTLNVFETVYRPRKLGDVTTQRVTAFVTEMRVQGRSEATIARHLRHLKAVCRWANRQGMLTVVPTFSMPKRVKGAKVMRGRPICEEEFERMLKAVPAVVDNVAAPSWTFYLKGLWASGLRLSESLGLSWDDSPDCITVDLSGRRPMFRIPAEAQKSNRDELLPMTPDFSELLQTVPATQRRGRVFKLLAADGSLFNVKRRTVGPVVSAIGEKAGVVVDERVKNGETLRKFASCHDLRRAFGQRWSRKLPRPQDLQKLMRHASLSTTFSFYVVSDAEMVADTIWSAAGDTCGDTSKRASRDDAENSTNYSTGERT